MALSGSLSTNKYNNIMGLKFSWTSAGQSIVDNTTTINWTLESEGGSDYSYYTGNLTLIVDGDTVLSIPSKFLMQGGGAWSKSGQITLKHNDDGKRSFSVSIAAGIYTYGAVNCTASTTFTIDQIKRRSVIAGSNGTLGSSNKLTLTRYNDAFTDTITATCGTESTTIATGSTATSVTWTPPVEWAAQNVSATSVTVTVTCKTYSGSTLLGYTSVTLTFAIPASVVPTVSLAVSDAKGYLATYGGYIQNKSQAKVTATAEGVYGSSIKSYTIACGSLSGTGSSGTFDLPSSGKITVKVTVMDSRGRSASASTTITVIAYAAPSVEITSRYRCDADGNEDYLGTYAIAVFTAAVTSLSEKNSAAYTLKYRVRGTTVWTSIALDSLTGNYSPTAASQIFPADIDSSYDVCITATDHFGTVESAYRTIQLAQPLMDFDRDNRAVAFLQRAVDANTIAFGAYAKFNAGTSLDDSFAAIINRGSFKGDIDVVDNADNLHINSVVWLVLGSVSNLPYENYGFCETWAASDSIIIQRITYINHAVCIRFYYNGGSGAQWTEWSWDNPPMVLGVEYLTTKRYSGKPVYVKLVSLGTLPNAAASRFAHGVTGATEFPETKVIATAASSGNRLAFDYGGDTAKAWVEGSNVVVDATVDFSDYTGIACLEYIKS